MFFWLISIKIISILFLEPISRIYSGIYSKFALLIPNNDAEKDYTY